MIKTNLENVFTQIEKGNNFGENVTLVGATKTQSVGTINQAIEYGLKYVAENKVQEFREKTDSIIGATQHFIGHLQTNKVKYLIGKIDLIHSVDTIHLAEEIDKCAKKKDTVQKVLLEVNVGNEQSKSGFLIDSVKDNFDYIRKTFDNVKVLGLMAMLPLSSDTEYLANLCKKMRELFDQVKSIDPDVKYLSMGTSGDYKIAVENGSNMIRLGRTIFGERKKKEEIL